MFNTQVVPPAAGEWFHCHAKGMDADSEWQYEAKLNRDKPNLKTQSAGFDVRIDQKFAYIYISVDKMTFLQQICPF